MNEIDRAERVQRLSPAKRALLLNAVRGKMLRAQQEHAISRRAQNGPANLSYAQQGVWFFEQLEPGSSVFNTPVTVRFEGQLNLPALQDSLREIARRHEILHTIFVVVDTEPKQAVLPDFDVPLPLVDLSSLSEAERDIAFRLIDREVNRPFDLSRDPLLRVTMLRLDRDEYILPLTLHHLVGDAWSRGILVEELKALYNAFSNGMPSPLSELPIQYADYAEWQREWLTGEILDQQLGYWKQQLDAAIEPVELPTDYPRPLVQTYSGAHESFGLSRPELESLKAMSQREGVTPFMTLLAAFNALLYRYTGQTDLAIGIPAANRNRIEVERLLGLFANVLVLRADLSGNPTFRELLLRVRRVALDAYTNQDLPFEKLVVELQPERSLSHHPLFQIMFVFENARMEALELPGVVMSRIQNQSNTAHFELQIILTETGMGLAGSVEYNSDLFEAGTIKRLVRHYERVLGAVVRNPEQALWQLPLLSETEQYQLLVGWNETERRAASGHCLHELFEREVERSAERVAVVFGDEQLSYGELNRRANQLAHYLRRLGVGPEVLVGLCVERSVEMVVGLLGILKAGGAYVPLDPAYPEQRLAFMLADAQVPVLLTNKQQSLSLSGELTTVDLSRDWPEISRESEEQRHSTVSSENVAYVIYTSGSTGRPKGVVLRHGGAVELMHWAEEQFGRENLTAVLASTSICFDLSVFELFAPLGFGGRVVLIESVLRLAEGSRLPDVTLVNTVPSAAAMLLRARALPASASVVNVAGEPLARELVEALYATGSVKQVLNLYGPTEDTTYSTGAVIAAGSSEQPAIGRPLRGRQSYVLDQHLQAVGIGVRGELYLGGRGLARGYWNRPELTAERFVPHPFSERGERLYRTGDQGRHLGDGQLAYFGRVDHQVKLRGYRIELGEIEAVLRGGNDVENAVVVVQEVEQRLVGYVVRAAGSEPLTMSQWRSRLSTELPEYMIPSVLVELEELPLLPNGKLDRRALPQPEATVASGERQTARTLVEELVANIWAEVLRVARVGVNENFFELGGHSLLATRVRERLRRIFNRDLPLRTLFEKPTVAELAAHLETARHEEDAGYIQPLKRVPRNGELPLSFAQQRLWFLDQLERPRTAYNIPIAVRLSGRLDEDALQRALNEVVRRHEALRTAFVTVDGKPQQVIVDGIAIALELHDLIGFNEPEQPAVAQQLITEEAEAEFDLEQAPLLRVRLLRLAPSEHILVVVFHHIVSDGWSLEVFVRELCALYEAFRRGEQSPLLELEVQYADFAQWQRERLSGALLEAELEYWRERLGGEQELLALPTDHVRPSVPRFTGAVKRWVLDREFTDRLRAFSRSHDATLFMTLLATLQTLLWRYTGQEQISIGTPIAGRTRSETEALIGFFVNTLVLRTDLQGEPSFVDLLARVRDVCLGAYQHQELPFEQLVQAIQPEREVNRTPLFQVMLVLQNMPHSEIALEELRLKPVNVDNGAAKFELTLLLQETADGVLAGVLEYQTELFEAETAARFLNHYVRLLEWFVTNPEASIVAAEVLDQTERRRLLVEWNQTRRHYALGETCLPELFADQARRSPDAIAASWGDAHITYAQLNREANQLAHYLRLLGIGPESRVAVLIERSLDMVVALLGVLKAGGCYVPLDPAYPSNRLTFMIEDAGVELVLTQQTLRKIVPNSARTVCLDTEKATVATESGDDPHSGVGPDNLLYVIYTSGSTGLPKGVAMTHRAISNLIAWQLENSPLNGADAKTLQFTALSFDVSIQEIFSTWCAGGELEIVSEETRRDPTAVLRMIAEKKVRRIFLPFVALQQLAEAASTFGLAPQGLREVITAGEQLQITPQLASLFEALPQCKLQNQYGPSESHVVSAYTLEGAIHNWPALPPIGKPISNTELFILDKRLEPVPIGVIGHLYLGGVALARGYLARPEISAEKFVPHPFSEQPGARLYYSGDLARYLPNGEIQFLGRADHQVKLRGYRIELGEIEAVLREYEGVQDVVAQVHAEAGESQRLVAYVVSKAGAVVKERGLVSYARQRLPEYMVPGAVVLLEEWPLLPSGKLNSRALPRPSFNRDHSDEQFVAPRTPVEQQLAAFWKELLGIEQVSIYDNFFSLGGHSLLLTQLASRIRSAMYVEVPLRCFFEAPTIAEMTQVVAQYQVKQHDPDDLAQMLQELSALSADEIQAMLAAELAD
jgi:amino acid adenylation domain-containing protein